MPHVGDGATWGKTELFRHPQRAEKLRDRIGKLNRARRRPWRRDQLSDDPAGWLSVVIGLRSDLKVVLVEIEQRVQLRLTRDQVLDPRLMLEGFAGLGLIVGQGFISRRCLWSCS